MLSKLNFGRCYEERLRRIELLMAEKSTESLSSLSPNPRPSRTTTLFGLPAWLSYSLITILLWGAWGAVSKVVSDRVDADTNQIFFTIGLFPLVPFLLWSPRVKSGPRHPSGISWAFLTGILAGAGNIAFFHALTIGGKASIVVPATALFPVVTVVLAITVLRERICVQQWIGLVLAIAAIYLLSI